MTTDLVLVSQPAPAVRLLTLNRPDSLNAITLDLARAFDAALVDVAADPSIRAVVVTGAGRGFCAGLDLTGIGDRNPTGDRARDSLAVQQLLSQVILRVRATPQPVIAAVNGPAAGFGLALSLASDIRFAAPEVVFRAAFMNIGVSNCDMGTSWLLPRLIGASRAFELMLTMRRVKADEAERIGLVSEVVDADALIDRAVACATQIAGHTPFGVRLTKQGMWHALELPSEAAAIAFEDRQQVVAALGNAMPEAIGAFLEKRAPVFDD